MPSRRAAVAVLSAALLTGAVAGGAAASSRLDPLGILGLVGLDGRGADVVVTVGPTPSPQVTTTPPSTLPATPNGPRGPTEFVAVPLGDREVDVPDGWDQVDQTDTWHDFLDPTLNLRLRIRFDEVGSDAKSAAEAAYAKRSDELADFRSPGMDRATRRLFAGTPDERTVTYYEFRYTSYEKEGTRYGVEWYLDGSTMIGGFGWTGQLGLVEPAMDRALESLVAGGGDAQ